MTRRILATALGVLLLTDALRVFLPSLITIFGDAGTTPPTVLGGFALAWFAAGLVAAVAGRFVLGGVIRAVGAAVLLAGHVALTFTDGGEPQLYAAAGAVAGGLWYLTGDALSGARLGAGDRTQPRTLGAWHAVGVTAGLAGSTVLHALLDTEDLVWRPGAGWLVLRLALLAAFGATMLASVGLRTPAGAPPRRYWSALGPAILLYGVLTGATARAGAGTMPAPLAVGLVAGCGVLAVLIAARPRRTGTAWLPAVALPVLVLATFPTTAGGQATWYGPVAQALGALALAGCLGWAGQPASSAGSLWRGLAAGAGMFGAGALLFGYYAAYDADLGFPNGLLLLVAALWVGAAVAPWRPVPVPARRGRPAPAGDEPVRPRAAGGRRYRPATGAVIGALAVLAGLAGALVVPSPPAVAHAPTTRIRLVTYNIRMGFDVRGRFAVADAASVLAAQHPDVVLLNEVDRGWFLNGGHDDLVALARRLRMRYEFAPAADPVWGDAVLTRLPIRQVRRVALPHEGPTGAGALAVRVALPGTDLAVVATHFQPAGGPPMAQARAAAALVRTLGARVVFAGDLNAVPGSPALATLRAAGLREERAVPTSPVRHPTRSIDHVYATDAVTVTGETAVPSTASDHLPVAADLEVR